MRTLFEWHRRCPLVCTILALLLISSLSIAQEKQDEELKLKYAPILGEYEFDLTEYGGQVIVLEFHVKSGNLWGDSGDGEPIILEPVADKEFEFTADDPDSGSLEITFLKNEEGEYAICHIAILDMGIEIDGNRIR